MGYSQETIDDLVRSVDEQKAKVERLKAENERLKAENETIREWRVLLITERDKLRKALDYYADPYNHPWTTYVAKEALKNSPYKDSP